VSTATGSARAAVGGAVGDPEADALRAADVVAVILAGGRASRLGGIDKPALVRDGVTLLAAAVRGASGCARTLVVGAGNRPGGVPSVHRVAAGSARLVDESPAHGGPAAALAHGVREATRDGGARWILVLAADLPHAAEAVAALLPHRTALGPERDALLARDPDGRAQPLLALYRAAPLAAALARVERGPGLVGASMRGVLAALGPDRVAHADLDARLCADVDTPTDMRASGYRPLDDRRQDPRDDR
jgi:molybdopterin-guanine dinucleotide biosynthesis protein A